MQLSAIASDNGDAYTTPGPRRSLGDARPGARERSQLPVQFKHPAEARREWRQRPPLRSITNVTARRLHEGEQGFGGHQVDFCELRCCAPRVPFGDNAIASAKFCFDDGVHNDSQSSQVASAPLISEEQPQLDLVRGQEVEKLDDAACVEKALLQVIATAVASFKSRHGTSLHEEGQSAGCFPYAATV